MKFLATKDDVERSKESFNELLYRLNLIEESILLFYYYGRGFNERQREDPEGIGFRPEDQVRYIVVQYAFVQMAAILDQDGKYSLHLQRHSKFTVSAKRLERLFPVLKGSQPAQIAAGVNVVLNKYKKTIETIFKIRNLRIAHIGDTMQSDINENEESSYLKLKRQIPSSFRFIRIHELCRELDDALLLPVHLWGFLKVNEKVRLTKPDPDASTQD